MSTPGFVTPSVLRLRAGDWVEVRSREEILSTLDESGTLDALPFMPEMLRYCGSRFRVFKRADKTCDTIVGCVSRRMMHAVHLEGVRCDGSAHDGCQAGCLLFWKEAWLRRVEETVGPSSPRAASSSGQSAIGELPATVGTGCTAECLRRVARQPGVSDPHDITYVCQATELNRATTPLPWWDFRQYLRELRSGNVGLTQLVAALSLAAVNVVTRRFWGKRYPCVQGRLVQTPVAHLDVRPGETVRIRSKREIESTLDTGNRNRGLYFDREMVRYCGRQFNVLTRVERIVNEKTGKMIRLPRDCVVLDGVTCQGSVSTRRLFCPRSIYPFWREIWLSRVDSPQHPTDIGRPSQHP